MKHHTSAELPLGVLTALIGSPFFWLLRRTHRRQGGWSAPDLALRRAVLPQPAALPFPFTVEEVVRMGRAPWTRQPDSRAEGDEGDEGDMDDTAVAGAMAATEVTGFTSRPFSAPSGGVRAPGRGPARRADRGRGRAGEDLHERAAVRGPPAARRSLPSSADRRCSDHSERGVLTRTRTLGPLLGPLTLA